jgi:anti-sigma B factor antagonist
VLTLEESAHFGAPVTLLTCSGSLVRDEATRLLDQLLVHTRHGRRHLLLDLGRVAQIDHVGAAALMNAHRRANRTGCTFGLVATSPQVLARLRISHLDSLLALHPTLEAALSELE